STRQRRNCRRSKYSEASRSRPAFAPDADAEPFQVDVLAVRGVVRPAALDAQPQVHPQRQCLAEGVVAVRVAVALQQPAAGAAFAALLGLLLPALEHADHGLQGGAPGLRLVDVKSALVGVLFGRLVDGLAHGVEETVFQGAGAPGRPKVEGDARRVEDEAVK